MNRNDRRALCREARRDCPSLDLRAGRITVPVSGTTDWGPDGTSRGVWGVTKPLRYVQLADDGSARSLTLAEERFAVQIYGPVKPGFHA